MAEFDLSRLWDDYGYDEELNCSWARRGRNDRHCGAPIAIVRGSVECPVEALVRRCI